jgi:GT2 family glycosyltransferase
MALFRRLRLREARQGRRPPPRREAGVSATVSVVMAALNEGPDLEATLALLCAARRVPDEIIVVDNGSREPLAPRVLPFGRYTEVRVIRLEHNTGSGRGKSAGLDAAAGDLLVVMDPHLRPPWEWLDITVEAFEKWPDAIMCPHSCGFTHNPPGNRGVRHAPTFSGAGARFLPHPCGFPDIKWRGRDGKPAPATPHGAVIPCILGGCYIFGRALMHRLGGYARDHFGYGYEQDQFSLRACAAGVDARLLDFAMPHHYRVRGESPDRQDSGGERIPSWAIWFNRIAAQRVVWEDPAQFEGAFWPLLEAHLKPHSWFPDLARKLAESERDIRRQRERLASVRARTDEEVATHIGWRICRTVDEYRAYATTEGRKA